MVTIEWIRENVGLVRAGDGHKEYGDPYTISGVADCAEGIVALKGFSGQVRKDEYREMKRLLSDKGFMLTVRDRIKGGRLNTVERKITMKEPLKMRIIISDADDNDLSGMFWNQLNEKALLKLEEAGLKGVLGLNQMAQDALAAKSNG